MAPLITAENISLHLPLMGFSVRTGVDGPARGVGGDFVTRGGGGQAIAALNGVSFTLKRGGRIGLIGSNGAGKSTLLRLLAGIYKPTAGRLAVNGQIATLFTSNIGINKEATGYENIKLMGSLLGMGRKEISELIPEIEEFTELGDYLNMPIRSYSAGMRTRLGFAIATSVRPDILLIDEVIGAGDRRFKVKAAQRVSDVISSAGGLILASHSPNIVSTFCDSVVWLHRGSVRMAGPLDEIIPIYENERKEARRKARKAEALDK